MIPDVARVEVNFTSTLSLLVAEHPGSSLASHPQDSLENLYEESPDNAELGSPGNFPRSATTRNLDSFFGRGTKFCLVFGMKGLILFALVGVVSAQVEFINDAVGDLSIHLLKRATDCDVGSTVFSAYSISTALGMCLLGSGGETFLNIKKCLGLNAVNVSVIQDGFSDSVTELTPFAHSEEINHGFVINTANRLYISERFPLSAHYLQMVRNIFHAKAASVDFTGNGRGVQNEINSFVSNQTRKLIPKILEEPLPASTVMTLVNALYFKGLWRKKMEKRPSEERFNAHPNGTNQKADWIGIAKKMEYVSSEILKAQLVEVPYNPRAKSSVRASMIFILPEEAATSKFREWLANEDFNWANIVAAIRSMKRVSVDLTLPKLKLESHLSLKKLLIDLGMDLPFTANANFTEMINEPATNLALDDVLHSAKMEVDEFGTEAAAATAVRVMYMSMPIPVAPKVNVTLNRSFVAMIILRQGESVVPLFTSVVNKL